MIEPLQRKDRPEVPVGLDPLEPEDLFPDVDDTPLPMNAIKLRTGSICWTPISCPSLPSIRVRPC